MDLCSLFSIHVLNLEIYGLEYLKSKTSRIIQMIKKKNMPFLLTFRKYLHLLMRLEPAHQSFEPLVKINILFPDHGLSHLSVY